MRHHTRLGALSDVPTLSGGLLGSAAHPEEVEVDPATPFLHGAGGAFAGRLQGFESCGFCGLAFTRQAGVQFHPQGLLVAGEQMLARPSALLP